MYLKTLTLSNFRSFEQTDIPLCNDLTILVGENNGGESNAIDAIRSLLHLLVQLRMLEREGQSMRTRIIAALFLLLLSLLLPSPPPMRNPG